MPKNRNLSKQLKQFLDFVDECRFLQAEERHQTDLLQEIEFASSAKKRNRAATQLHRCRENRRKYKDMVKRYGRVFRRRMGI